MRGFLLVAVAALALAGCQSEAEKRAEATGEVDAANAGTAEVAKLVAAASKKRPVQPGLWKAELKIEAVETADNNPRALALVKGLERSGQACRTADQLKPFEIDKLEKVAGTCTFAHMRSKGGKVDADVTCKKDGAPDTRVVIRGTTSPTGFDVVTENRTGTQGQKGYSLVRMRSIGTRLGGC